MDDEFYYFNGNPDDSGCTTLATVDETTFDTIGLSSNPPGYHPLMWIHEYDGGRAWYFAVGHFNHFKEPLYQNVILGGIYYAAGVNDHVLPEPPPNIVASSISDPRKVSPSLAADFRIETSWEPMGTGIAWIYADLHSIRSVNGVTIDWGDNGAIGGTFKIQVSEDTVNWVDMYSTTTGATLHTEIDFAVKKGRYVRVYISKPISQWPIKMAEFKIKTMDTYLPGTDYWSPGKVAANIFESYREKNKGVKSSPNNQWINQLGQAFFTLDGKWIKKLDKKLKIK